MSAPYTISEILDSQRSINIGGQLAVDWTRGSNNVGIICILHEYIESRQMEEMSILDAEAYANAILAICNDAREAGLKQEPQQPMKRKE